MTDHPAEGKPLLPCPFCGGKAAIEQHGTMRQSCIIACEDCSCRLETGEVFDMGRAWNTRHSQGGKASMTSANLAALIHEARFPEGKDAPNYIPFLHEDRSGREYCLRIARKIIETVELAAAAPSPSGGAPDSVSAEEIGRYAAMCPPPARIVNETRMELLTIREKMAKIGAASWMQRATPSPAENSTRLIEVIEALIVSAEQNTDDDGNIYPHATRAIADARKFYREGT